jgi:hypothetical protein
MLSGVSVVADARHATLTSGSPLHRTAFSLSTSANLSYGDVGASVTSSTSAVGLFGNLGPTCEFYLDSQSEHMPLQSDLYAGQRRERAAQLTEINFG